MSKLRPLIIIAIIANSLTFVLYNYVTSLPGGSGVEMIFGFVWMPVLWLASIISAILVLIIKRKYLFQKGIIAWSLLILLFTTPFPAFAFFYLTHPTPDTSRFGMTAHSANGKVYKTEFWEWTSTHKKYVDKHFSADSAKEAIYGDKAYKKDSLWIYFDNNHDTLKIEFYKEDSLISTRQLNQK